MSIHRLLTPSTSASICIMCSVAKATCTNSAALASGDSIDVPLCDDCATSVESKAARAALMKRLEPYRLARPRDVYVREYYRRRPQRLQDVLAELADMAVDMGAMIGGERFVSSYITAMSKSAQRTADDE